MQNIIRISGKIMLLTCLSLMLLTSCSQKSKLKLAIEVAGKQCPISVGVAGEVTSIDFDGADVVYSMSMNEDYINLEALGKTPDAMKSGVSAMFNNPKGEIKKMLELVVASQSGIKFIYKGKTTGKEVECYLNTEDLKKRLYLRNLKYTFHNLAGNITLISINQSFIIFYTCFQEHFYSRFRYI